MSSKPLKDYPTRPTPTQCAASCLSWLLHSLLHGFSLQVVVAAEVEAHRLPEVVGVVQLLQQLQLVLLQVAQQQLQPVLLQVAQQQPQLVLLQGPQQQPQLLVLQVAQQQPQLQVLVLLLQGLLPGWVLSLQLSPPQGCCLLHQGHLPALPQVHWPQQVHQSLLQPLLQVSGWQARLEGLHLLRQLLAPGSV